MPSSSRRCFHRRRSLQVQVVCYDNNNNNNNNSWSSSSSLFLVVMLLLLILLPLSTTTQADETQNNKKKKKKKQQLQHPHILFIVADDFGWNDIGYHQNSKSSANPLGLPTTNVAAGIMETPTLDTLASEGVKLDNYYVQQLCSPTRATIMTGRYPSHNGIGPNVDRIDYPYGVPSREVFFPELLQSNKKANYSTHMVGKWHLGACAEGYHPTFRGFDSYVGYLAGGQGYYNQGGDRNSTSCNTLGPCLGDKYKYNYSSIFFAHESKRIIENHSSDSSKKEKNNPLFLYLAFQSVHNPYDVPPIDVNATFSQIYNYQRRIYSGMISMMDRAIKDVIHSLRLQNMWDDTVLIFTSDNGGIGLGSNYPLRGTKVYNWEGGIKAVGFVRGTNNPNLRPLPANTTSKALMHSTDWFLTIVEGLAGINNVYEDDEEPSSSESTTTTTSSSSSSSSSKSIPKTTASVSRIPLPLDGYNQWNVLAGLQETTNRTTIFHQVPVGAKPIDSGLVDPKTNKTIWTTSMCMHYIDNRTQDTPCSPFGVTGGAIRHGNYKLLITHPDSDTPWGDTSSINNAYQSLPGGRYSNGSSVFVPTKPDVKPIPFESKYFLFDISNDPTESYNLAETMPNKFHELLDIYNDYAANSAKPALNWRWGFTDPTWRHNPHLSDKMKKSSSLLDDTNIRTSRSLVEEGFNSSNNNNNGNDDDDDSVVDETGDGSSRTCMGPFLGSEYCSYGHEWECYIMYNDLDSYDIRVIDNVEGGTIECQSLCELTDNCNYWVYIEKLQQTCKLKSNRGNLIPCEDCVFGPKVCPS